MLCRLLDVGHTAKYVAGLGTILTSYISPGPVSLALTKAPRFFRVLPGW